MINYIVAILVGLLAGVLIYFILNKINLNSPVPRDQFQRSQQKIISTLQEKKDTFDKEITDEYLKKKEQIEKEINGLTQKFDEEKEHYNVRLSDLEKDYKEKRATIIELDKNAEAARAISNQEKIENEQSKLNNELNKLNQKYKEEQDKIEKDFFQFSEQISMKKAELISELKSYQDKQNAIIARFKADEEKKNKLDFYRMKLSEAEIEDIKKLKSIADQLNNPTVLYKLIWENYYKSKFSELIGRIAPEKAGCGIYKITNIENGKVYIGQTKQTFNDRLRSHVRRGLKAEPATNNKLYAAMWEQGPEQFTFEIITKCKAEELNEKERYFIEFYQSREWGYNSQSGPK